MASTNLQLHPTAFPSDHVIIIPVGVVADLLCFFFKDPLEDDVENPAHSVTNSAAELLKQGAGNQAV